MDSVTQYMRYRQSLMTYAEKYGVVKASRRYNKSRSYIYFWLKRYDGTIQSLKPRSKRPHAHPKQHTEQELKLIHDMRRRNPKLGMIELWHRLRKRGYARCPKSLFRVLGREGLLKPKESKKRYKPKPYEQMSRPGQRIQIDVKVVPRRCISAPMLKLYQYTAIDEYSRMRYLGAYEEQSAYSSADFLHRVCRYFSRMGVKVECVQTDNGFEFTNRFSGAIATCKLSFKPRRRSWGSDINSSVLTLRVTTAKSKGVTGKTRNASTIPTASSPSPTLAGSSLPTKVVPTTCRCALSTGSRLLSSFIASLH